MFRFFSVSIAAKETFTKKKKETLEEVSVNDEDLKAKKLDKTEDGVKAQNGEQDGNVYPLTTEFPLDVLVKPYNRISYSCFCHDFVFCPLP